MSTPFTAMLQPLYAKLGVPAQYVPAGGGAAQARQVILDNGGVSVLDGLLTQEPSLRAIAADYPAGIARGAQFTVGATAYLVNSAQPMAPDGAELHVALKRAA